MKLNISKSVVVIHLLSVVDDSIVATLVGNNGDIQLLGHRHCGLMDTTPYVSVGTTLVQILDVDMLHVTLADLVTKALKVL